MSTPFLVLRWLAVAGLSASPILAAERNPETVRALITVLQSNAPVFDKARACQQLGEFGDRTAVPALAALLADEQLGAYARSGLEGIPDPAAAEALRAAASTLQGLRLAGAVNSLGVLRDAKAVGLLTRLARDPAAGVAREALLALGCIATDDALPVLREALRQGPGTNREAAASACLLAAERRLTDRDTAAAVGLYDAVRQAEIGWPARVAATRGAIVARHPHSIPLLLDQLRSPDLPLRHAALTSIREIPSDPLATALNAELDRAPADLRVQLLIALIDCHNPQSLPVVRAQTTHRDPQVRTTALTVLSRIGGTQEAVLLLQFLGPDAHDEERTTALGSLRQMQGPTVDAQILATLASATDPGLRVSLMGLIEARGATQAVGELLKQAADPDPKISVAALRALKALAGPGTLPGLIALTRAARNEAARAAAEDAVAGVCLRAGTAAECTDTLLAELDQAGEPPVKNSWITILVDLGQARALPAILAATRAAPEPVATHALERLAHWPDPAPIEDLLAVVESGPNSARGDRALASVIQLATAAAEDQQRPPATVVRWFRQAIQAAQTPAHRRLIISGLGRVKHLESFLLLAPYLEDPELRNEAAAAVIQVSPAVRQADPVALRAALEKIVATVKIADLNRKAAELVTTLPTPAR